jgi:hypothetical protein
MPAVGLILAAAGGAASFADELFLTDATPSEAILSAEYHPIFDENGTHFGSGTVDITFRNGATYQYPCSAADWIAYKSAPSKGQALHQLFKQS